MFPKISAHGQGLAKYDWIVVHLFRNLTSTYSISTLPQSLPFTLQDVRAAMGDAVRAGDIDKEIKNVADIKYTYDARRDLPPEVLQAGPLTWLQAGKGKYMFQRTARKNVIELPAEIARLNTPSAVQVVTDQTPPFVARLLGSDEQAVFTRVRNAGLISHVLGFLAWPIQGHHRTTVWYGQVEVDEVQAGLDGTIATIVPISGKGGQDKLSWSQALNLNTYGAMCISQYGTVSAPLTGVAVKSLGLWRDDQDVVWIVEFSPDIEIDDIQITKIRRFMFL
jgi:hypothetical protein